MNELDKQFQQALDYDDFKDWKKQQRYLKDALCDNDTDISDVELKKVSVSD